jgi:hypothetical protein
LYVTDAGDGSVRKIGTDGVVSTITLLYDAQPTPGTASERVVLGGPHGIFMDSQGQIYLTQTDRQVLSVRRTAIDPRLRIMRQDSNLLIFWQRNARSLEASSTVANGWHVHLVNPKSPAVIQPSDKMEFFRIVR